LVSGLIQILPAKYSEKIKKQLQFTPEDAIIFNVFIPL
jgi:hypothetical protein